MKKIIITETQLKKIVSSTDKEEEQFKNPIFKGVKTIKYRETGVNIYY